MMTPKEIAEHITKVAEGKVGWTKAPCELWIEREINEYVQQQVKNCLITDVVSMCCDETRKVNQFLKRPSKYCMTCSKELN